MKVALRNEIRSALTSVGTTAPALLSQARAEKLYEEEKSTAVLVEIDPTDYEVALARARADFADAQAQASAAGINIPLTNVSTSII